MLVYLEPLDTLFFRDSRPFDAGEDTFAESTLPSPLAIYGAIGSYILKSQGRSFEDFYNSGEDTLLGKYDPSLNNLTDTKLRIKRVSLSKMSKRNTLFFSTPANLFSYGKNRVKSLKPEYDQSQRQTVLSDLPQNIIPLSLPPRSNTVDWQQASGYLGLHTFKRFLSDDLSLTETLYPADEFLVPELRYGIKMAEGSRAADEGYLYGAGCLRFKQDEKSGKSVIAVQLDDINGMAAIPEGICSLGGEGGKARISMGTEIDLSNDAVLAEIKNRKRFFIYLITPAIFKDGWRITENAELAGADLVGAAVNKPEYISGWVREPSTTAGRRQVAGGSPREMRKAVPAGSVYFFKALASWDFKKAYTWAFENSISDEYRAAGFGAMAMGVW